MKETRWELKKLGEYARYFLIVKNAVDKVVREYTETLTEHLNIDKESGQPDFEQLKIQCTNIKIARDKADELLSWYYACYLTMATKLDDIPIIPTEHHDIVPNDISSAVDATKEEKENMMLNNLKCAVCSKEETEDEGTNETGE